MENGRIKSNPAKLIRRRRENNARIRFLSDSEEKQLRRIIQRDYSAHMPELEIALHTGIRCGEQYGLKWEDVDLVRRIVTIRLSKNGSTRYVRLNAVALAAFQALFERSQGNGFIFVNSRFERLMKPRHWFEPAGELAGLEEFTWHCLRHTFASRLVMKGVNLRAVQNTLGHKSIQMTCRYAHLAPDYELAAVEKLCETEIVDVVRLREELTPVLTPTHVRKAPP